MNIHQLTFSKHQLQYCSIARYLVEIIKKCAENFAHQSINFSVEYELKLTYMHLKISNFFRGLYPRTPTIREKGKGWEGREGEGRGEGGRDRSGGNGRGSDGGEGIRSAPQKYSCIRQCVVDWQYWQNLSTNIYILLTSSVTGPDQAP